MFEISKSFGFEAAHRLEGLREGHQCGRLHGHSFEVVVTLRGHRLSPSGFVKDYGELDFFKRMLAERFDHRVLNEAVPGMQPSAELLAEFFFNAVANHLRAADPRFADRRPGPRPDAFDRPAGDWYVLHSVTVKETGKTAATYSPFLEV